MDADASRRTEGRTIYHQGPKAPVLLARVPARLATTASPASSTPPDARIGIAIVQVVVSANGTIARMQVVRAPDLPGLTDALVAALRRWRFEPARLDGEPVPVYFMVTVELRSGS